MKITTFTNSNNNNFSFRANNTDYSKILDAIISSNLKKTNKYLNGYEENNLIDGMILDAKIKNAIDFGKALKGNSLITAAKFIANFSNNNHKLPYEIGHKYYFDGTPIIFHLDSIEIGNNEYYYDDFNDIDRMNLSNQNKKLIIDIYTNGNTTININI